MCVDWIWTDWSGKEEQLIKLADYFGWLLTRDKGRERQRLIGGNMLLYCRFTCGIVYGAAVWNFSYLMLTTWMGKAIGQFAN